MITALVDIERGYEGDDSPRYNAATPGALVRRGLITDAKGTLTKRGQVYKEVALIEHTEAKTRIKDAIALREKTKKAKKK